jgi:SAM-dependent methyltransferase
MGVKGSFYDTIEGLYNLARLGQPVGLRTVLHSLTINRLTQYAEFIYRNLPFVVQVAFMGMETIGFAKDNLDQLWVDPYEYREQLSSAVKHLARRMVGVSIYNHQLCILPSDLWPYARKSITTWKQAYPSVCAPCRLKESCGGVFGTGEKFSAYLHPILKDMHSGRIKPFSNSKYRTNDKHNFSLDCSATFLKFIGYYSKIKDYPILDAPCGFARHSFLLSSLGYKVICVDISQKVLDYISEYQKTHIFEKSLVTIKADLEKEWPFENESLGAILNVHYYGYNLLDKFRGSLVQGGFLYLETPGGQGGNYVDLPLKSIVRTKLERYFKILYYKERSAGPVGSDRVTLKVFAQKL